jgi:HSP20 family molecular chaperone IbpA
MENEVEPGKKYRLARAAVQMEEFSVSELIALTDISPGTVGHFLHELSQLGYIKKVDLPANGRGRPRKSYELVEGGRKHLLAYMRLNRLKLEPDSVPFPELGHPSDLTLSPVQFPVFYFHDEGSKYFVQAAVPGLDKRDIEVSLDKRHLVIQVKNRIAVIHVGMKKVPSKLQVPAFVRNVHLPDHLKHAALMSHTVRNGILTVEVCSEATAASKGSTNACHEAKSVDKA